MWDHVGFGHGVMDDNRLKELDAKGGGPKKSTKPWANSIQLLSCFG
jgi:hypothetical protein